LLGMTHQFSHITLRIIVDGSLHDLATVQRPRHYSNQFVSVWRAED
jgi:hypothetical protein